MILFDQNTPVDDLNDYLKNRLNFLNKSEALIRYRNSWRGQYECGYALNNKSTFFYP